MVGFARKNKESLVVYAVTTTGFSFSEGNPPSPQFFTTFTPILNDRQLPGEVFTSLELAQQYLNDRGGYDGSYTLAKVSIPKDHIKDFKIDESTKVVSSKKVANAYMPQWTVSLTYSEFTYDDDNRVIKTASNPHHPENGSRTKIQSKLK